MLRVLAVTGFSGGGGCGGGGVVWEWSEVVWGRSGAGAVWGEALGVSWRLLGLVGTFSCGQLDVLWGFLGVLEVSCNL